ncbi:MAG: hypothetical protein JKY98_01480 [Gammaproteobacteria bacterium]|nr:hypothetical protein [Gammaproteobacteria bacterium]
MSDSYFEVLDVLSYFKNSKGELSLSFEGDTNSYPCKVTALNVKHRVMVVESSTPILPYGLKHGKPLKIVTANKGREITLHSKYIEPLVADFSAGFEVTIPENLGTNCPRAALRYMLDEIRNGVRITLNGNENQTISGFVQNISSIGIGMKSAAELPRFLAGYLTNDQQIVDCHIALDKNTELDCKMEIRNVQNMVSGESGTFIGGRMLDMNKKDNAVLSNFIRQLQQMHLKSVA